MTCKQKKMEAETLGDTKGEVQKMSLPNTLAYMRAKAKTEALVDTVIVTVA